MQTKVQKWGHSLAVRIPRAYAKAANLEQDSSVEISVVDGALVLTPVARPRYDLEDLLAQITDENIHAEVDLGPPVGKEVW